MLPLLHFLLLLDGTLELCPCRWEVQAGSRSCLGWPDGEGYAVHGQMLVCGWGWWCGRECEWFRSVRSWGDEWVDRVSRRQAKGNSAGVTRRVCCSTSDGPYIVCNQSGRGGPRMGRLFGGCVRGRGCVWRGCDVEQSVDGNKGVRDEVCRERDSTRAERGNCSFCSLSLGLFAPRDWRLFR